MIVLAALSGWSFAPDPWAHVRRAEALLDWLNPAERAVARAAIDRVRETLQEVRK